MFVLLLTTLAVSQSPIPSPWQVQTIATDADFRGLCVVSDKIVWVSGTKGTVGRTTDAGKTWQVVKVPGAEKLDFRDIEAFGESTAYAMSAGNGADSRIYKTTDAGKTWTLQFQNNRPEAFYDAMAFWDEKHGIALSDPVDGYYRLIATEDGGEHWQPLPTKDMPPAVKGEGAFAASGTCLIATGQQDAWFITGGGKNARLFHTTNRGKSWTVQETPLTAGNESSGGFSIAFRDADFGIIVGGDYRKPKETGATMATTRDGGKSWKSHANVLPFCSAVACAKDRIVTVGIAGSHISTDAGVTWHVLDRENSNSVRLYNENVGWSVGPKGRIAKFHNPGK